MVISLQIRIRAALAKDALLIRYNFLHNSGLEINVAVTDPNFNFFSRYMFIKEKENQNIVILKDVKICGCYIFSILIIANFTMTSWM